MRSPYARAALVLLALTALVIPHAPLPAQQVAESERLTLRNATRATLTVETQLAVDGACGATVARVVRQALLPGRSLTVTAARSVCWRRLDEGPTGERPGSWERFEPGAGARVVTLN